MKMKTGLDLELRNLLRKELNTLKEYVETFDDMTVYEKDELREWMAHGNSVNNNPYLLYVDNGCLMDFVNASRIAEDMSHNPEEYRNSHELEPCGNMEDDEFPF